MLITRIALRYLFSRKSHAAVNIISYISIAAVAIAAAAMVIVLSVFNGFADFVSLKLSLLDPPLRIESQQGKVIEGADSIVARLNRHPDIALASPMVEEKAFAMAGDYQMPLTLRGIDPQGHAAGALSGLIIDGDVILDETDYGMGAIASVGVANGLHTTPSYPVKVRLYEPRRKGRLNPANPMAAFKVDSVVFTGVYRVEQAEYDNDMLMVPLEVARNLLDYSDEATYIEVVPRAGVSEATVRRAIAEVVNDGVVVKNGYQQQEQALKMISVEKWVTLVMLAFILIIASFNILSTMSMIIVEKRNNRQILMSLGATPEFVAGVYARLAFMISGVGGLIGVLLGTVLALAQQVGGFIKMNAGDVTLMAIDVYPVRVNALDIIIVIGVILLVGGVTAQIVRHTSKS